MRRQRALRTASASSLCIFCACRRLGAIAVPTAATSTTRRSFAPLPANPPRRNISTIRSTPLKTPPSTSIAPIEHDNESLPPWDDPHTPLSMSEQRERSESIATRQQHESGQVHANQERLGEEQDERRHPKRERDAHHSASRDGELAAGSSFSQAMLQRRPQRSKGRQSHPAARPSDAASKGPRGILRKVPGLGLEDRNVDLPRIRGRGQQLLGNNETATLPIRTRPSSDREGGKSTSRSSGKATPAKVSNPFGMAYSATSHKAGSTAAISGWGAGSAQLAPLQYAGTAQSSVTKDVSQWGDLGDEEESNQNIQHDQGAKIIRKGHQKSFKPTSTMEESTEEKVEDQRMDDKPQLSEPMLEAWPAHGSREDPQVQQSIYDRASNLSETPSSQSSKMREETGASEHSPATRSLNQTGGWGAAAGLFSTNDTLHAPEQPQASSTETGAPEAYDHNDLLEQAGYVEYAGSISEPVPEASTSQDPTPSSTETSAISYSSEPPSTVANAGSYGYSSEEAEGAPAPQPQRQEPSQVDHRIQQLEQPSSRHLEAELSGSSFGSFDSDRDFIPETRYEDPVPQASPLARTAHQTQRVQETRAGQGKAAEAGKQSPHSTAQKSAGPPLPPAVPPPTAVPAGGQLAWQPIDGHAQGGQWIWQSSLSPQAMPKLKSQHRTRVDDSARTSSFISDVHTPERPGISLGDSGYRATPFNADDYRTESSFDEEKAAGWQHLRRTPSQSGAAHELKLSAEPISKIETPKPQIDFDDDTWVDKTFNNHIREREERLKAQKEREQKRQAQSISRERENSTRQDRSSGPRRGLYNEPNQADRQRKCARCGEIGHIARFCPRSSNPFTQPNSESRSSNTGSERSRDFRNNHISNSITSMPFERRHGEQQSQNPFGTRDSDKLRKPFASRGPEGEQNSRKAWGADQVISTEPGNMPAQEQRFETFRRFVPTQDFQGRGTSRDALKRFEPEGGRRTERADDADVASGVGSAPAHRSDRFRIDVGIDEHAPVPETRASREKAARKSRWADADEEVEEKSQGAGRKVQRAGRREYDEDEDEDAEARDRFRARKAARQAEKEAKEEQRRKDARKEREVKKAEDATPINIPEFVSVQQLSQMLGVRYEQFIDRLEELGYDDVFPGMTLNSETSGMIAMEYNFDPTVDTGAHEEEERDLKPRPEVEDKEFLPTRPPVVTIMGHVDHGKTTILDYLRKSSVAAGEAGGITQHIGAFSVPMASSGKTITFLDTPGHAAFLAMRQRGANVTDIVILVVAADDSVKPQTLEAIKHAKAAGVPMIVAINKVDKEEADIQRVKQDLARHGVEIEDFGGETQIVPVSGKTGKGMDELEETVVALSEILDHRAETDGAVEGWVLEATTKERGRVATVLVRRGTLRPGVVIVAGKTWARVRTLQNEGGRVVEAVGPGMPIEVDGWRDQPMAGDEVLQAPTEQKATSVVEFREEQDEREKAAADMEAINEARRTASERQQKEREAAQARKQAQRTANAEGSTADVVTPSKPDDLDAPQQEQTGQMEVPFIIKADVSGSAEAVSAYIMSVANPLIAPTVLHSQVGPVHESDVELADAAGGHIIAFNLPPDPQMQGKAEALGVKILQNNIIYRVLDDVKSVLEDKLPPIITQRVIGEAEVGAAFDIGVGGRKKLKIAGCKVRNGMIGKGARVRVLRGKATVYDGTITSLKNVKKEVTEMRKGTECGMGFRDWEGFEVGDQVQTYEESSEKRKL